MPKFLVTTSVTAAAGHQYWEVEADSIEEAKIKFDEDGGEFINEEVEVTDIEFESIEPQE